MGLGKYLSICQCAENSASKTAFESDPAYMCGSWIISVISLNSRKYTKDSQYATVKD